MTEELTLLSRETQGTTPILFSLRNIQYQVSYPSSAVDQPVHPSQVAFRP